MSQVPYRLRYAARQILIGGAGHLEAHALLSTHEGSYYSGYSKITYIAVLVELAEISEILRKSIKQLFNIKHNLRWNYIYGSVGI